MNRLSALLGNVEKMIAVVLALSLSAGMAASPAIGTAQARGNFQVDNSPVFGSASLFEGSRVQTANAASTLDLTNGTRLQLSSDSRVKIYGDHSVLEQGASVIESATGRTSEFRVQARNLWIETEARTGSARVSLSGRTHVQVAAINGGVRVRNAQGMLVANLAPGTALEFDPQSSASGSARMSGCLQKKAGKFSLTDETTSVTVELRGAGLDQEVGNNVVVNGTMESGSESPIVNVASILRAAKGCSGRSGKAAAAGVGGAAAAGWALSGTTIAIIGGVAAAATVGGLAAADKLPGQDSGNSPGISK